MPADPAILDDLIARLEAAQTDREKMTLRAKLARALRQGADHA